MKQVGLVYYVMRLTFIKNDLYHKTGQLQNYYITTLTCIKNDLCNKTGKVKQFFHMYQMLKGGHFKMARYSEVTRDHPVTEHGFIFGAILD